MRTRGEETGDGVRRFQSVRLHGWFVVGSLSPSHGGGLVGRVLVTFEEEVSKRLLVFCREGRDLPKTSFADSTLLLTTNGSSDDGGPSRSSTQEPPTREPGVCGPRV